MSPGVRGSAEARRSWAIPPRSPVLTPGWPDLRRILAVRLDAMGDVLMTTPALRAIRQSARGATLTLLTSPAGAAAARHVPEVDRVIVHSPPWMPGAPADPAADLGLVEELRSGGYDAAIVFTVHTQSALPAALLCHLAGIPKRLAHARETPYGLLTDWIPEPETVEATRHEVRRQLDLVGAVGYATDDEHLSFRVPPEAMRRLRDEILPGIGVRPGDGRPWAVIHPGASAASRRYPAERFAEVACRLARDDGWRIVVTGGPDEADAAGGVAGAAGGLGASLAGRLDLGALAALLAVAPVLVAGNTGPVHLAAAVGTPVVDLYALTNPQHTPWLVPHRVLNVDVPCRGCRRSACPLGHQACLDVEPAAVVAAARDLLADEGQSPSPPARAAIPEASPLAASFPRGGGR